MGLFETTDEELYQEAISRPLAEKIEQSLAWIRDYEAEALRIDPRGYYVAFSGGKDSIVLERLFQMAGVRYEAWYNNTTIDPPELIRFIREHYPQVPWNNPKRHLIAMMAESTACGPPTRKQRWCCEIYKEQGGNDQFVSIGVRGPESKRRKATWSFLTSHRETGNPILCPLIYWTDCDIWQFIRRNQMSYCKLYDEGFKRLGCIGCPLGGPAAQKREFKRWPKYEAMWKRGFQQYFDKYKGLPKRNGEPRAIEKFANVEALWRWWLSGKSSKGDNSDCQSWLW